VHELREAVDAGGRQPITPQHAGGEEVVIILNNEEDEECMILDCGVAG